MSGLLFKMWDGVLAPKVKGNNSPLIKGDTGGCFLIGPAHEIEPEVPWENVLSFVQAVREFGEY